MRVLAIAALRQPGHDIIVLGTVQRNWVPVEQIWDDGVVAIGGVLVCHQLTVLPDTDDIWKVEDGSVLVDGLAGGLSDVGFDVANFDGLAGWLSSRERNNQSFSLILLKCQIEGG